MLVATTLLAALEQDKGELPTNRKLKTLWMRQSWLPTVHKQKKAKISVSGFMYYTTGCP